MINKILNVFNRFFDPQYFEFKLKPSVNDKVEHIAFQKGILSGQGNKIFLI